MSVTIQPVGEPVFTKFTQLAIDSRDPRGFAKFFADVYGVGPWFSMAFGDDHQGTPHIPLTNSYIDGQCTGDYAVRTYVYAFPNLEFEIVKPTWGRSVHEDFLAARNDVPGVHHLDHNMKLEDSDRFDISCNKAGLTRKVRCNIGDFDLCQFSDQRDLLGVYVEYHKWYGPKAGEEAGIGNYPEDGKMPAGTVPSFRDGIGATVVVRDAGKVAEIYAKHFGIGPWEVSEDTQESENSEPVRRAVCVMDDGWTLEVIEPLSEKGRYAEFLAKWGPSVFAMHLVANVDSEVILKQCKDANGIDFEIRVAGQKRLYLDHLSVLGTNIQVMMQIYNEK